jgi:tetratricopeptide (TPR) repeat protein
MGDRLLEAELEQVRGIAAIRNGRFAEGARTCARAAELARLAGRHEVAALAMVTAAAALACTGDMARVLALLDTAAEWPSPGRSLEAQLRAARAYTLSRLGERERAEAEARRNLEVAAGGGDPGDRAVAAFDLGSILLDHGAAGEAASLLGDALAVADAHVPLALARLRLAGALARDGRPDAADAVLEEVPFTPVRPADLPEALVARLSHAQGLVAAARGDSRLAARRFEEARRAWRRIARDSGDRYTAVLVDLGRPPVAGLVDPERELARLADDHRALITDRGG